MRRRWLSAVVLVLSLIGPFAELAVLGQLGSSSFWTMTAPLQRDRYSHTSTLLPSGLVLVAGGGGFPCDGALMGGARPAGYCYSTVNSTAELYDPATGNWSWTGSLSRRSDHSATLLSNGTVLVVGGFDFGVDIGRFSALDTAELYDPATETWSSTGSLNFLANVATLTLT